MTTKRIALLLLCVLTLTLFASCRNNNGNIDDATNDSSANVTSDNNNGGNNNGNNGDTSEDITEGTDDIADETDGGENNNGNNGDVAGNVSSSSPLPDIMTYILDGVQIDYALAADTVADDQFEWNFFIPKIEGSEGYTSLAMIGSIPHAISLLRVPEGTDVDETVKSITENINPRKWICVEAEATAVESAGNVILVAMSQKATVDGVKANFEKLK